VLLLNVDSRVIYLARFLPSHSLLVVGVFDLLLCSGNLALSITHCCIVFLSCVYSRCEPRDILSEISNSSQHSTSTLPNETYQQVIDLLQLVKSTCGRSPIASAMSMEELAAAIHGGTIHSKVEVRILTAKQKFPSDCGISLF